MTKRITTIVIAAVTATAMLAACGDDDKKSSDGGSSDTAAAGDDDAYCARVETYEQTSDALDSVFDNPAATGDDVRAAFETMADLASGLEDGAPAEISADLATLNGAVDRMLEIFEQYDWDFAALETAPEGAELGTLMESAEVTAATDRLDAWALDTCGIDMND